MQYFRAKPDDTSWGTAYDYDIDAAHKWSLPGLRCPQCGATWSIVGVQYPAADLSNLPSEPHYRLARAVAVDEFLSLRDAVAPLVPDGAPLPPGTKFGPLVGRGRGRLGDFAWPSQWTMLARPRTLQALEDAGISGLLAVPTQVATEAWTPADLLEVQVVPRAHLAPAAYPSPPGPPCSLCGRIGGTVGRTVLEARTVPEDVDVFRPIEAPTRIIVSERFAAALESHRLTDILLEAAETAD